MAVSVSSAAASIQARFYPSLTSLAPLLFATLTASTEILREIFLAIKRDHANPCREPAEPLRDGWSLLPLTKVGLDKCLEDEYGIVLDSV